MTKRFGDKLLFNLEVSDNNVLSQIPVMSLQLLAEKRNETIDNDNLLKLLEELIR